MRRSRERIPASTAASAAGAGSVMVVLRERERERELRQRRKKKEKSDCGREKIINERRKMPPRSSRSRSRGAAHLEEERSSSSIVAVDVADGLVAREYHCAPKSAVVPSSSPERRTRSLALPPPRPRPRRRSLALASALKAAAASALLPAGFPDSVTSDYLAFQAYDSLQGLCSYVRGVCSSAAVLSGLGVGQQDASSSVAPTLAAAATINAARDAVGMVAGFFLAAAAAPRMDADAKRWRLAADVSNDLSLVLEVVAAPLASAAAALWFRRKEDEATSRGGAAASSFSFFSRPFSAAAAPPPPSSDGGGEQRLRAVLFALVVCLAAAARALTGVAGGATRAALTAHFCRGSGGRRREEEEDEDQGEEASKKNEKKRKNRSNRSSTSNAGDVAAKEGSQEAAVSLVGMLLGLLLTRASTKNPRLGALAFALLTGLHVFFNAKALRCLRLTSLNGARLELVVAAMVSSPGGKGGPRASSRSVLTPADAAALEPLWPPPFLSFSRRKRVVMGVSLGEVAEAAGKSVEDLLLLRRSEDNGDGGGDGVSSSSSSPSPLPFVAAFSAKTNRSLVALRSDCSPSDEAAAYVLGLLLSTSIGGGGGEEERQLRSPGEAERWLRRRWFGERTEERGESNGAKEKRATATKPLAELLLEQAGWDPIGRCGVSLGGQQSNLRYELLEEGRRKKGE